MAEVDHNIGRHVSGRYRLDELLGRGGFGSVYRGWDTEISRPVAVKLLDVASKSRSRSQDAELRARFRREAMAAGRINHPCVVTVFDFGVPDEAREAFLVMELLDGHDLAEELVSRGPMNPKRVIPLFLDLLDGLAEGHALGIIHKDLKPQNIFVRQPSTAQETLCLVDFGVARVVHEDKLTLTGMIVGTPQYMAPEYITDTLVTPALDVYQVGLMLAETLTGVPAIPLGESFVKSCNRHFTGDLDIPKELLAGEFGAVLQKALAPKREDRFESAAGLARALAAVDPSSVTMDLEKTTVFRRAERAPTFEEPPLFPPMRPDEVTAELARTQESPPVVPTLTSTPPIAEPTGLDDASSEALTEMSQPAIVVPEPAEPSQLAPQSHPAVVPTNLPAEQWGWDRETDTDTADAPVSTRQAPIMLIAVAIVMVGLVSAAAVVVVNLSREQGAPPQASVKSVEPDESRPTKSALVIAEPLDVMRLDSEPSGAQVFLDGESIGTTPHRLEIAEHTPAQVELRLEDYEDQRVDVESGDHTVSLVRIEKREVERKKKPRPRASQREKPVSPRPASHTVSSQTREQLLEAADNALREPAKAVAAPPPTAPEPETAPDAGAKPEEVRPRETRKWSSEDLPFPLGN